MKRVVILGAGAFAREVHWLVDTINASSGSHKYEVLGYLDDDASRAATVAQHKLLGGLSWLSTADRDIGVIMGVGFPHLKRRIFEVAIGHGFAFETLIHPGTQMASSVEVGRGTIITAGNILTVDIKLGECVLLNLACTIGHGSSIGRFSSLSPHCTISGNTQLGEGVDLGSCVTTKPGVSVGAWSVVGLNSGVVKDLPSGVVATGCPARPTREVTRH